MRLRTIDLNLPMTLEALVAERSVSRAALRMGLTQSAVMTQGAALKGPLKSPAMWSLALTQGGYLFGIAAPIVTGYVVAATGGYSGAFLIAGVLLLGGAVVIISGAQIPIRLSAEPDGQIGDHAVKPI
jgi:hypothetical protein